MRLPEIRLHRPLEVQAAPGAKSAPEIDVRSGNRWTLRLPENCLSMDGYTFAPGLVMSRTMTATVLQHLSCEPEAGVPAFADVEKDIRYSEAVARVSADGIVSSCSEDAFGPDEDITRWPPEGTPRWQ